MIARRIALVLSVAVLAGCAGSSPRAYRGEIPPGPAIRIAILPFLNLTGSAEAARVVMDQTLVELLRRKDVTMVTPAEVEAAMTELRIRDAGLMTVTQTRELGEKLSAALFVVGSVTDYRIETDTSRPLPIVSVHMRAVRPLDGSIAWAAQHTRTGSDRETVFGIGRVTSLARLAERVVRETLSTFPRRKS